MKKRLALVILIVACIAMPMAAAGNKVQTIKFLTMAEYHNALDGVIKAFEASHPGVKVETEEFPFAQLFDAIEIKLGSRNSSFDVVLTDATMVSGYAYRGFICPVDRYFSAQEKAKFTPALVGSGTFEGKFYSPPLKNSCHVSICGKQS